MQATSDSNALAVNINIPPTILGQSSTVAPKNVDLTVEDTPAGAAAPPPTNPHLTGGMAPKNVDSTAQDTPAQNVDSTVQETPAGAPPTTLHVDSTVEDTPAGTATPPPADPIVSPVGKKKGKAKVGDGKSPRKRTATDDENQDPGDSSKRRKTTVKAKTTNVAPLSTRAVNVGAQGSADDNGDELLSSIRRSNRDRGPPPPADKDVSVLVVKKKKGTNGQVKK
jgi:hypothetical protein